MRKCPFCNKEIKFVDPWLFQFSDDKTWSFSHSCPHRDGKIGVVISIYGDTEEEVIAKWDGVYYAEEQTSESL
jgi:hypothetical protein